MRLSRKFACHLFGLEDHTRPRYAIQLTCNPTIRDKHIQSPIELRYHLVYHALHLFCICDIELVCFAYRTYESVLFQDSSLTLTEVKISRPFIKVKQFSYISRRTPSPHYGQTHRQSSCCDTVKRHWLQLQLALRQLPDRDHLRRQ